LSPATPTVAALEAAFLTAWPAVRHVHDGAWIWREAGGFTKRANSAQCHDPADDADAPARLQRCAALSRRHGIAPVFRVTPLAGPGIIAALDAASWTAFEPSRVLTRPLAGVAAPPEADILPVAAPAFLAELARLEGYDADAAAHLARILGLIAAPAAGLVLRDADGEAVAAAVAVAAGRIAVFLSVVVDAARRGEGHGGRLMHAGLAWGASAGAEHAALQVTGDNVPALALYRRLGFADRYGYDYRRP
jgi:ribosomal protein S18 acetylase RimI-like enzyme